MTEPDWLYREARRKVGASRATTAPADYRDDPLRAALRGPAPDDAPEPEPERPRVTGDGGGGPRGVQEQRVRSFDSILRDEIASQRAGYKTTALPPSGSINE